MSSLQRRLARLEGAAQGLVLGDGLDPCTAAAISALSSRVAAHVDSLDESAQAGLGGLYPTHGFFCGLADRLETGDLTDVDRRMLSGLPPCEATPGELVSPFVSALAKIFSPSANLVRSK